MPGPLPLASSHSPRVKNGRRSISTALAVVVIGAAASALSVSGAAAAAAPARTAALPIIHGIYVTQDIGRPIPAAVLASPAVDGVVLRIYWNTLEPSPGRFEFSALDRDIASVVSAGKRYTLGVIVGTYTPAWVAKAGARVLPFTVSPHNGAGNCRSINVPEPWDRVYLKSLDGMIAALGAHIRSNATRFNAMTQVKVTGIGEYTEETRMPIETPAMSSTCRLTDAVPDWRAHGYRPSLVEKAWNNLLNSWAAAFPGRSLGNNFINKSFPGIDESGRHSKTAGLTLTEKLIHDGTGRYGARFAVQTQALRATTGTTPFVQNARRPGATIGYQLAEDVFGNPMCQGVKLIGNRVKTPCDPSAIQHALQLGKSSGAAYIEVFPRTVAAFGPQLVAARAALNSSVH
jgi:hypothetical protein